MAFCLLLALTLSCSSDNEAELPEEPAISAGAVGSYTAELNFSLAAEPLTLNPLIALDPSSQLICSLISAPLFELDHGEGTIRPGIAGGWERRGDGAFVIRLRDGVRFSDGRLVTSDDVVASLRAILAEPRSPFRLNLTYKGQPASVDKIDKLSVRLRLPFEPGFPPDRLLAGLPVVPAGAIGSAALGNGSAAGVGPFVLESHIAKKSLALKRNPHYWKVDSVGKRLPYIEKLNSAIITDREVMVERFRLGRSDLIDPLYAAGAQELARLDYARLFDPELSYSIQVLCFNFNPRPERAPRSPRERYKLAWFKEKRFRKAVSLLADRGRMARELFGGKAEPLHGVLSPINDDWEHRVEPFGLDRQQALAMLEEAGFVLDAERFAEPILYGPNRVPVQFTLLTDAANPMAEKAGEMIAAELARFGAKVTVLPMNSSELWEKVFLSHDFDAAILEIGPILDPISARSFFHSTGPQCLWAQADRRETPEWARQLDSLLDRTIEATSRQEQLRLFREAQAIIIEQMPFVPLVARRALSAARQELANLRPTGKASLLWNAWEIFSGAAPGGNNR